MFKGSTANIKEAKTIGNWIKGLRDKLKEKGVLIQKGNVLELQENHSFSSPSAVAGVVLGRTANSWIEWKNKGGKTLDEKERKT